MSSSALSASPASTGWNHLARRVMVLFAASLVVAAASKVAFPLPFTPVPFTLQPLAVLVVGLFLGPIDGALALLAYLAEGASGLPVFSPTGPGGLLQLLGPTGGFLLAYPVVAGLTGFVARRLMPSFGAYWAAVVAGSMAITVLFFGGSAWLGYVHPMSLHALWIAAVAPFLPGELVKVLVAAGLFQTFNKTSAP